MPINTTYRVKGRFSNSLFAKACSNLALSGKEQPHCTAL